MGMWFEISYKIWVLVHHVEVITREELRIQAGIFKGDFRTRNWRMSFSYPRRIGWAPLYLLLNSWFSVPVTLLECISMEMGKWQFQKLSSSERKSTLNIHWKDWDWSWSSNTLATWCKESTYWKSPWCWERLRAGEGNKEEEMVGWHHWLNGHDFKQTQGDVEGQGSLLCCSSWACKESDMT